MYEWLIWWCCIRSQLLRFFLCSEFPAAAVADNCLPVDALEVRGLRFISIFFLFGWSCCTFQLLEFSLWISSVLLGDERKNFAVRRLCWWFWSSCCCCCCFSLWVTLTSTLTKKHLFCNNTSEKFGEGHTVGRRKSNFCCKGRRAEVSFRSSELRTICS